MVRFVFGRTGSGKSVRIYSMMLDSALACRRVLLVVPEQEAVNAERSVTSLYTDRGWIEDDRVRRDAVRRIEVTTFSRLCDEAARSAGNIGHARIGDSTKLALSYRALAEAAPELTTEYFVSERERNGLPPVDAAGLRSVSSLVSALRSECVTPDDVDRAAEKLRENGDRDCGRLSDLAAIYRRFTAQDRLAGDAEGRLAKLIDDLSKVNIFSECDVYIDRFYTYTGQEYAVIRHMMSANALTFTVAADSPDSAEEIFAPAVDAYRRICAAADEAGVQNGGVTVCREPVRFASDGLRFINREFSSDAVCDLPVGDVREAICGGPYSEAEYVASDILRRVHSGCRYSDCAVVMRDVGEYKGICDAVFTRRGIPCFMSKRTDAVSKPPVKFVMTALMTVSRGFRREDFVSWLKTGLCGISDVETSQYIAYINLWELSGERLCGAYTMNPDGFGAVRDEDTDRRLEELNSARDRVMPPLVRLKNGMSGAVTVLEKCRVLYDFLEATDVSGALLSLAAEAADAGDVKEANDLSSLWKALCDTLDILADVTGDLAVGKTQRGTEHFRRLLTAVFSADIGVIPTSHDEVVIADAALTRLGNVRHVYVMGAEEGVFPRDFDEDPLLPVREQLLRGGIDLHCGTLEYWQTENYRFYNAVCAASETLTVTCSLHAPDGEARQPSAGFERIKSAFSIKPVNGDVLPPEDRLFTADDFIAEAAATRDPELKAGLENVFDALPDGEALKERLEVSLGGLTARECSAPEAAKNRFPRDIRLSPSQLQTYLKCNFSYFCKYALNLPEKRSSQPRSADIGTFVHEIMERGVKYLRSADSSEEGLLELVNGIADRYLKTACGDRVPEYLREWIEKLKMLALSALHDIRDEFSQRDFGFFPVGYEIPIGQDGGIPAYKITDETGNIIFTGIIDRLDAAEKNGGGVYFRIVDYKTGAVSFKPKSLKKSISEDGELSDEQLIDSQLILYMFAVEENGAGRLFPGGGGMIPAGIVYYPVVSDNDDPDADSADLKMKNKTAMLLKDSDSLTKMEPEMAGRFIPIRLNADGSFNARTADSLMDENDLSRLRGMTEAAVKRVAADIRKGKADADPKKYGNNYPCKYCPAFPICRNWTIENNNG